MIYFLIVMKPLHTLQVILQGGVPYGFTWEEEGTMQELFDSNNNENQENGKNSAKIDVHDENLPFRNRMKEGCSMKKPKEERKRDIEILEKYHQHLTEKELEPLFQHFNQWKSGELAYYELTEFIHEFHKKNQKIWSTFNCTGLDRENLIFHAKRDLNMFNEKDLQNELYQRWMHFYDTM